MRAQRNLATPLQRPAAPARHRGPPAAPSPLGRPLRHQLTAADLDVARRSREAMTAACGDRPAVYFARRGADATYRRLACQRKADGPRALDGVALLLVLLANLGAGEADLRAVPQFLDALVDDLYPAAVRRSLDAVDLEEARLEARENELFTRRRVVGRGPAALREEAAVNRAEARVQLERARLLEAAARRAAAGMSTPDRDADAPGRAISTSHGTVAAADVPARKIAPPPTPRNRTCPPGVVA